MPRKKKPIPEELNLVNAALNAKKHAHVLWGFSVGAAVLANDGRVYVGCNIESYISGLGICAERCAIDHAILHGNKKIKKIAVVMDDGNASNPAPCGVCLQYINDFSNGKATVIIARAKNGKLLSESVSIRSITELLPIPFKSKLLQE